MKPFYKGEIIVEEERLEELFRRIEEAKREIYNCYAELEHIGILKFKKAPASESRGNQVNCQKMKPEIFFICDGEVDGCKKTQCFYNGTGKCKRTSNIANAKNFNHSPGGLYLEKEPAEKHHKRRKGNAGSGIGDETMTIEVTPKEIADLIEILLDRQTSISAKELTEILNRQAVEDHKRIKR